MKAVVLYHKHSRERLEFSSIKKAADALGVKYQKLRYDLLTYGEYGNYILSDSETQVDDEIESDSPRIELDNPHYATIDGKEFVAVKCTDKTNCTVCDIYKLNPPLSMIQYPLCYEYNCGTHKIVDICAKYKCIWKRKHTRKFQSPTR